METTTISSTDDLIDLRDVIARVEELREENDNQALSEDESLELIALENFLQECKGNGGDEQWEGDWYPVTAIRESYFKTYAQELAEDIGAIPENAAWPARCIDWDQAARELKMDYTGVEFAGVTYYVR